MGSYFREALELNHVELYLYDGPVPIMLGVADGTALLAPIDEQGIPTATIETENETILAWVETQLDEYRAQSTQVTADDLPP